MQKNILAFLARLSDTELVARMKSLVARARDATAELVAHLAEMDTRDVYLREGYASLFVYCRDALGLSEAEAGNRIVAARAARRFPLILEMLAAGTVNLTTVRLLAPHLTAQNHRDVLESARGKRKVEVEEIVARLAPRPDVPSSVRKLPASRPAPAPPVADPPAAPPLASAATAPAAATAVLRAPPAVALSPLPLPVRAAALTPLSPDRYKLQLTIGGETVEKLRLAKDMLGHAVPSGDDAAILDRALTALLVELAKKKFSDTPRPRSSRGSKPGDVPAAVKRAVWVRDLGRCAFIGPSGHRCNERRFVEFHHLDPRALGGEASVDLIALRCRRHNDYEGRLYFGRRRRDGSQVVGEQAMSYGSRLLPLREHVLEHVAQVRPVKTNDARRTTRRPENSVHPGPLPEHLLDASAPSLDGETARAACTVFRGGEAALDASTGGGGPCGGIADEARARPCPLDAPRHADHAHVARDSSHARLLPVTSRSISRISFSTLRMSASMASRGRGGVNL